MNEGPYFVLAVDLRLLSDPRDNPRTALHHDPLHKGSFLLQDQLEDPFLQAAMTETYIM